VAECVAIIISVTVTDGGVCCCKLQYSWYTLWKLVEDTYRLNLHKFRASNFDAIS